MKEFKKVFSNPPKKYRPIPFWSWNEKLSADETAWQIDQMDQVGMGGYFMHARGGLQTEYMEEEWMENIRVGIREGKQRQMGGWGYDENGWPSGFGNGIVNGLGVAYQQKYLRYELTDAEKQTETTICNLPLEGKNIHFYYDINPFYVDTLDQEVIAKFLEAIHDRYVEELGEVFSDMAGFFTDEPQVSRNGIPWSFVLPKAYRERYGEDLLPSLSALFFEVEGYEQVRFRFWQLVRDLFTDAFAKQCYEWCEAHNTRLTGHMVLEESMEAQITSNGACMPSYEYMHIPGIDWLGRILGPSLTPVQVASVAAQTGKKQILSESFALCGWDVSFEELKWVLEWQMVRGINLLCPHLEGYSLRGIRKRDYPATLFYQQPWWSEYKKLIDYFSRVGMVLAEGDIHFKVLVVHPMSTGWLCFNNRDNGKLRQFDDQIAELLTVLEEAQIPYHLGDERIMERYGEISEQQLKIGQQSYSVVIVPNTLTLSSHTVSLLEQFQAAGGKLLFSGTVPTMVDGAVSDRVTALSEKSFVGADFQATVQAIPSELCQTKLLSDKPLSGVVSTVREFEEEGYRVHYIVNSAQEERTFTAQIAGKSAALLDAKTGEICPIGYTEEKGTVCVPITLAGMGSILLLVYTEQKVDAAKASDTLEPINPLLSNRWMVAQSDPNALTLDTCDCYFDGELQRKNCPINNIQEEACRLERPVDVRLVFRVAVEQVPAEPYLVLETPEKFKLSVNSKAVEMVDCGYYRDKTFRKISLKNCLQIGENELELFVRFEQSATVYENLKKSLVFESEKNKLTYDTEIEAVYLIGDFGVKTPGTFTELPRRAVRYHGDFSIAEMPETVENGDLVPQGFPFFNGRMVLKQTVSLSAEECVGKKLVFGDRCTTVTKVWVNGTEVDTILWQPYEVDLTGLLKSGENEIAVELIGNLRNLLGPHHLDEGECHFVCPGSFFENSPIWSNGKNKGWNDDYCFVRYGIYPES